MEIKTIKLGRQEWSSVNLGAEVFKDGRPIRHAKTFKEWIEAGKAFTPAWCYVNNDADTNSLFGKLYNRFVITEPGMIIPEGLRLPTSGDWRELCDYLEGVHGKGFQKKMLSKTSWSSFEEWKNYGDDDYRRTGKIINPNGDNGTELSIFPSGMRKLDNARISNMALGNRGRSNYEEGFTGFGIETAFWISDKKDSDSPNENSSYVSYNSLENVFNFNMIGDKALGMSIRCICC